MAFAQNACQRKRNYNLCAECFLHSTSSEDGQAEEDGNMFNVLEPTAVKSMCKSREHVFHFGVCCNECEIDPISDPVYKFVEDPDYNLCLTCFDSRLTKKKIVAHDFKPIMRPALAKQSMCSFTRAATAMPLPSVGQPSSVGSAPVQTKVLCLLWTWRVMKKCCNVVPELLQQLVYNKKLEEYAHWLALVRTRKVLQMAAEHLTSSSRRSAQIAKDRPVGFQIWRLKLIWR